MDIQTQISHLPVYKRYQQMITSLESYLQSSGFLKLDLPVLLPALIPESYLEVFETEYRYMNVREKLYLTPSPELMIKRLLVAGIGDCYYLGRSFRNSEPASSKHLGEFTMLEMYKVGASYLDMADIVLSMMQHVWSVVQNNKGARTMKLTYQGITVDLASWEKVTVAEAFLRYANIDAHTLYDHERFIAHAQKRGYQTVKIDPHGGDKGAHFSYEELWSQIYANEVEPHLGMHGSPTLLYDYPVEFASLSRPNTDGKTAQRFECYIAGVELGNCYGELSDWRLQEQRLQSEHHERSSSGRIQHPPDWGFIDALKEGLPDCAGIAIGVERLGMILTDSHSIQDLQIIQVQL